MRGISALASKGHIPQFARVLYLEMPLSLLDLNGQSCSLMYVLHPPDTLVVLLCLLLPYGRSFLCLVSDSAIISSSTCTRFLAQLLQMSSSPFSPLGLAGPCQPGDGCVRRCKGAGSRSWSSSSLSPGVAAGEPKRSEPSVGSLDFHFLGKGGLSIGPTRRSEATTATKSGRGCLLSQWDVVGFPGNDSGTRDLQRRGVASCQDAWLKWLAGHGGHGTLDVAKPCPDWFILVPGTIKHNMIWHVLCKVGHAFVHGPR